MEREILFRGFHEDKRGNQKAFYNGKWHKGQWVYGAFCGYNCDHPFAPMKKQANIIKQGEPNDGFWFEAALSTVGQFTGETDKSGAKIFEGDVVEMRGYNGKHIATVYFKDGKFAVDGSHYGFKDLKSRTYTKIGTIYDKESKDDISLNCTKPKCNDRSR